MKTYFTMLLLGAIVSFLMTPLARRLAFRIGAVDAPGPRKIHRLPMARTGGWAVVAGFCLPWIIVYCLPDNHVVDLFLQSGSQEAFVSLLACGLLMFALGVADDIYNLGPKVKLLVQIIVAAGMCRYGNFRIPDELIPFVANSPAVEWISPTLAALWIVGITNATNLLDGMDGLVAGVAAIIALSLAVFSFVVETGFLSNVRVALLTFTLAGATLGFLPYNFTPARIFLGDSGSLFIGLIMAGISTFPTFDLGAEKASTAPVFMIVFVLLFALPLFDTTQVVIGRLRRGQHPFSPDKTHVHHRLLQLGLNQRQATVILYLITLFLGVVAIVLSTKSSRETFTGLAIVGAGVAIVVIALSRWVVRRRYSRPTASTARMSHGSPIPPSPSDQPGSQA